MGADTKIEWATHTFNPWRGCEKIAPGCKNCYAEAMAKRNPKVLGEWGPSGVRIVASEAMWQQPVKWNKDAEKRAALHDRHSELEPYVRPRVFCASMADVFEDWKGNVHSPHLVIDEPCPENGFQSRKLNPVMWHRDDIGLCEAGGTTLDHSRGDRLATITDVRRRLFSLIDSTPHLDWLLLTKRPENIKKLWPLEPINGSDFQGYRVRKNVWLGTSIACQADADRNISELLNCSDLAPVLFLSIEPLVAPVDLVPYLFINDLTGAPADLIPRRGNFTPAIDWVIVGGESGPNARPLPHDWVRLIRDQCQAAAVPFFFKQWGEWMPRNQLSLKRQSEVSDIVVANDRPIRGDQAWRVGKKFAGRLLDGREWNELPEVQR